MKKYKNYAEQIESITSSCTLIQPDGDLMFSLYDDVDYEYGENGVEVDDIIQWFAVDLKHDFDEEARNLYITWSHMLGAYVMAVFQYGTPWEDLRPQTI